MASERVSVRLPLATHRTLLAISESSGFASPSQMVRTLVVEFVKRCKSASAADLSRTLDELEAEAADHLDPTQRRRINERL